MKKNQFKNALLGFCILFTGILFAQKNVTGTVLTRMEFRFQVLLLLSSKLMKVFQPILTEIIVFPQRKDRHFNLASLGIRVWTNK